MKKILNNKAFTLAELLIVVAIISVLCLVSIPVFATQLEKSKESSDISNLRSAKAAAMTLFFDNKNINGTFAYDANSGKLIPLEKINEIKPYGKGTKTKGGTSPYYMNDESNGVYNELSDVENGIIKIVINNTKSKNEKGAIQMYWNVDDNKTESGGSDISGGKLSGMIYEGWYEDGGIYHYTEDSTAIFKIEYEPDWTWQDLVNNNDEMIYYDYVTQTDAYNGDFETIYIDVHPNALNDADEIFYGEEGGAIASRSAKITDKIEDTINSFYFFPGR